MERRLEVERGGDDGRGHGKEDMERPRLGPTGIANDTTWTGSNPRHERREGSEGVLASSAGVLSLFLCSDPFGANEDEKLAFCSESSQGHNNLSQCHGKSVVPGWRMDLDS